MSNSSSLPIDEMQERHLGLTKALADCYTEAARVCMDRHHVSPTSLHLEDENTVSRALVTWTQTDDRTKSAWANEIDTTEAGAYAFAIAAAELSRNMVAVHRAETRTGADWYLAPMGKTMNDLEECVRLEVSGVDQGSVSVVRSRLRQKLVQASKGISDLPAIAGVVGFKTAVILLTSLEAE